ncbi:BnaA07g36330D [Brassica napus]|uniref:BnaA07g36330D protein n=1 Tax=Brassica napus TaxID=3708 RepID=A0A078IVQ9_BRANA|nr:BnaA07g36330D [Brassica napus]
MCKSSDDPYILDALLKYSPCSDTQISKRDGFIVGVAISRREAFFLDQVQLYPCDSRLGLAAKMAQLVLFRPKVDEISIRWLYGIISMRLNLFFIFFEQHAIRSYPVKVADGSNTITLKPLELSRYMYGGVFRDRNLESLNSLYEVKNMRQYSLTALCANAVNSLSGRLL